MNSYKIWNKILKTFVYWAQFSISFFNWSHFLGCDVWEVAIGLDDGLAPVAS